MEVDPEFADPDNGDFTLSASSPLLGAADDGFAIGDLRWDPTLTAIEEKHTAIPVEFQLKQNYPNPFNPQTTIEFSLQKPADIELSIYNVLGGKIATLVSGSYPAGAHKVNFDAENLSTGVYLYRLTGDGQTLTGKMMYLR